MKKGRASRRIALDVLLEYSARGTYIDAALSRALDRAQLDRRDRAFVTEMVLGTVRMMRFLDLALSVFADRDLASLDVPLHWVLRLTAYQVLLMDVPDHAACDTAVSLANDAVGRGAGSYANAVTRALVEGKESIPLSDRTTDPVRYLGERYSLPGWICETWAREQGMERAEALCAASNRQPAVSLRCNLLRTTRERTAARLRENGARVEPSTMVPEGLLVRGGGSPAALPGFDEGWFSVQDQGSMAVAPLVEPEPGMRVLDVCAAPGGKANHIAELMGSEGEVVALDRDPARLAMVSENAYRLGNRILRTVPMDATEADPDVLGMFDRVLVDAPCSGLGTLARRADLRWRKRRSDVEGLVRLQEGLLRASSRLLGRGGLLVYSTCTISRAENDGVVDRFLRENPDYRPEPAGKAGDGRVRLMPDTDLCDGMFIARMRRVL